MVDFVKFAALAKRLIEKNGRTVTINKYNRTPANLAKPWHGNANTPDAGEGGASISAIVCFVPPTGSQLGRMVMDGQEPGKVKFDQIGIVATASLPSGTNLEEFDEIVDGTDTWKITARAHLQPAATSIMYAVGLTK